jgi:hypothetical protein
MVQITNAEYAALVAERDALRVALAELVRLNHDWSCGTAYVRREFVTHNDAAIAAARDALRLSA